MLSSTSRAALAATLLSLALCEAEAQDPTTSRTISETQQFSLPVRILEDPAEVEAARGAAATAARRDAADLVAQESMARSDREAVAISWGNLFLAAAGTALLVGSLFLSIISTLQANRALSLQRQTTENELRAWVSLNAKYLYRFNANEAPSIRVDILNVGRSPALDLTVVCRVALLPHPLPLDFEFPIPLTPPADVASQGAMFPGPDGLLHNDAAYVGEPFTAADVREILEGNGRRLYVFGRARYRLVFDSKWRTTTLCQHVAPNDALKKAQSGVEVQVGDIHFTKAPRFNDVS